MRIYHVALASDWAQAQRDGAYAVSTRGVTLAEEGFIHASREEQWPDTRARYYADVAEPLVLLVVETERLTSRVVEEKPPGSDETFPHVYGPIDLAAVVDVVEL